ENFIEQEIFRELCSNIFGIGVTNKIEGIDGALGTHPGLKRKRNEDRLAVGSINLNNSLIYCAILCDGVGGSAFGDLASSLAIATIFGYLSTENTNEHLQKKIENAVLYADKTIQDKLLGDGATTLSMLVASSSGEIYALNIGDSRIFSWEPSKKALTQVSCDDTIENEVSKLNIKDKTALEAFGLKGTLSQALGESNRNSNDLNFVFYDKSYFNEGFILVSDGAWKDSETSFEKVIKNATNSLDVVRRTLALATWCGGTDNSSIIAFSSNPVFTTENKNFRHNHSNIIIGDTKYSFLNEKTNIKKTSLSYKNKKKPPTKSKKDDNNSKEITIVPIGNNDK
ncbi:serine/threonine-protein phosphatase, partial [Salmonella enterica]|nr:serine/threonine-protein phosphatase [Salmonella enterica]